MSKHYRKKIEKTEDTEIIENENNLTKKEIYDLNKKKKEELKQKEEKKKNKKKKKESKHKTSLIARIFAIMMLILMMGSVIASISAYIR